MTQSNGGPTMDCNVQAYEDFVRLGGDHIGAEQYGCAIEMRNRAQVVIHNVFASIGDLVDDHDATIHVGRIAERIYAQSTNTARALRESLYTETADVAESDDWDAR